MNKILATMNVYAKPDKRLIDHLIETGFIAKELCSTGRASRLIDVLKTRFSIGRDELISTISFLCAAHDVGKAHPGFQKKIMESTLLLKDTLQKLKNDGIILDEDNAIRHERYSREIVEKYLIDQGITGDTAKDLAYIIAYHHQGKVDEKTISEPVQRYKKGDKRWEYWHNIQNDALSTLNGLFPVSKEIERIYDTYGVDGCTYLILSVMVTSDWIASGSKWSETLKGHSSVAESATCFVAQNGLYHKSLGETFKGIAWDNIFTFPKNEMQAAISDTDLSNTTLLLLEYPCGYGKTESALLAALKMGAMQGGIYTAAPTTSTAKGLSERISDLGKKAGLECVIPELDSSMVWSDNDMAKLPKELWTSRTRHQFLYPYAVGTIDQVLKCILSFRYSCIGMLGLTDKVVIIDEVHAYDSYMLTELSRLIEWCRFLQVPVILLSATLPTKTKQKLFKAAGFSSGEYIDASYPLISIIKDKKLYQSTTACAGRTFPIGAVRVKDVADYMHKKAVSHRCGCLAIIMPTVDTAFDLYDRVCRDVNDCEVILYHGRDTIQHKEQKVKKLLKLLGKDRKNRPKKLIVIATSIIEQSLDVDFDEMYTSLAPIDLLIQRLGRVWRHPEAGTIREIEAIKTPFTIVIPEEYRRLNNIYDSGILFRTEKVLSERHSINTVDDVRNLVDEVYSNDYTIPKDGASEIYAGYKCLGTPFNDECSIISGSNYSYLRFDQIIPQTREETYPTIQIAILDKGPTNVEYNDMAKIMRENVVPIAAYKLENDRKGLTFDSWDNDIKWFDNIKVFIGGSELCVVGNNGERMRLTEDGLRFE